MKGKRVFLNHGYHVSVIIFELTMHSVVSIVATIKVGIGLGAHHCPRIFPKSDKIHTIVSPIQGSTIEVQLQQFITTLVNNFLFFVLEALLNN